MAYNLRGKSTPVTSKVNKAARVNNTPDEVSTIFVGPLENERLPAEFLDFGKPEELTEEEKVWREKFASTTPEQLARMEKLFSADEQEGTFPLDFSGR